MAWDTDSLQRAEVQLEALSTGAARAVLDRWRTACTGLAEVDVSRPAELRGWLRQRPNEHADEVLRSLVSLAQRGDTAALLAVVVCLTPGIRGLARYARVSADEAMSEVTLGILEFPVRRRRSVAGGLLLDARNRLMRAAHRTPQPSEDATGARADTAAVPGNSGHGEPTTAERVLALICEARRQDVLDRDDAQLIVDTRLGGQRVAPAAARLGISAQAAYQRRTRAEHRISTLAQETLP